MADLDHQSGTEHNPASSIPDHGGDLIQQIEDALWRNSAGHVRPPPPAPARHPASASSANLTSGLGDPLRHFLLPRLLNSTLQGNANGILTEIPIKTSGQLAGIYAAYAVIFVVSLLANSLVCYVIAKNKRFRSVTYAFIANLSASDLTITVFNIPYNLLRFTLTDWQFGLAVCKLTNLALMCSIYASTFTMAAVAVDRYMVILYPLRPRLGFTSGVGIVAVTWLLGAVMSLPFPLFARVERVELLLTSSTPTNRCRLVYPPPEDAYDRYMTLATALAQFVFPLSLAALAYGHIVRKLWSRKLVGQATYRQKSSHERARRRTIKMLIVVVAVFSACWLPLNLYHVLTDFHPDQSRFAYSSSAFLACHWLAMSSCCYNPFIYCWFNAHFRHVLRSLFGGRKSARKRLDVIGGVGHRDACARIGGRDACAVGGGPADCRGTPLGGATGVADKSPLETRSAPRYFRLLERMRIAGESGGGGGGGGSAQSHSSGTRITCRSKSSSRRDRNPRRLERGMNQQADDNQQVLNTI